MEHNQIIPTKPIKRREVKKKLKTLSFLYNMATLKILKIIKWGYFIQSKRTKLFGKISIK